MLPNLMIHYTYILQSKKSPEQYYYGYTTNLRQRLEYHNTGLSSHTNRYKPWKIICFIGFEAKELAMNFEKYLKTASGKAFMRKRLIINNQSSHAPQKYSFIKNL